MDEACVTEQGSRHRLAVRSSVSLQQFTVPFCCLAESTYFFTFLIFMLAVLTQERRRGSAGCSGMSSLLA